MPDVQKKTSLLRDVDESIFFTNWFLEGGDRFVFLFNQNIRQTDIQYSELISLIRVHAVFAGGNRYCEFSDSDSFKSGLKSLLTSMGTKPINDSESLKVIIDYISNKIVADPRFGTSAVYTPPGCSLSVGDICGEAGYVHSVGRVISFRNAVKLTKQELTRNVRAYISRYASDKRPIFIVPYSHEAFSGQDKGSPFLKGGLDDLKLNMAKMYVGSDPLEAALHEVANLVEETGLKCQLALSNDYRTDLQEFHDQLSPHDVRSWFMIIDSDVNSRQRFPMDKKYFVFYEQLFANRSRYQWFDENKPAWVSHTTLPHSLASAMINLTRPFWRHNRPIRLCDPFGGSGTVYFEAQKHIGVTLRSSDLAPASAVIAKDNVDLFSLQPSALTALIAEMKILCKAISEGIGFNPNPSGASALKIKAAYVAATKIIHSGDGDCLSAPQAAWDEYLTSSAGSSLTKRVLFYCCLKGLIRHKYAVESGIEAESKAIAVETDVLIQSLERLSSTISAPTLEKFHQRSLFSGKLSRIRVINDSYSVGVRQDPPSTQTTDLFGNQEFLVMNVLDLPKNSIDLIVADPPYGFNTEEEILKMATLFRATSDTFIDAISDEGGQIILAVPEVSFTGRPIPAVASRSFVVDQIIRSAMRLGRRLYRPTLPTPGPSSRFEAPYYWYSEKALKRAILHFWVAPRNA